VHFTLQRTRNSGQRRLYYQKMRSDSTTSLEEKLISDLVFTDEEDVEDITENLYENEGDGMAVDDDDLISTHFEGWIW
jgi:hypothetical protein